MSMINQENMESSSAHGSARNEARDSSLQREERRLEKLRKQAPYLFAEEPDKPKRPSLTQTPHVDTPNAGLADVQ